MNIAAAEEEEIEVVSVEEDGPEAEDVFSGTSVSFHQFEKIPNFMVSQVLSHLTLQATNFFI